jgi:hypothetical protein
VKIYLVVSHDRLEPWSSVHKRAYPTREAAAKRVARLENSEAAEVSFFRVEEVELVGQTTPLPRPSA